MGRPSWVFPALLVCSALVSCSSAPLPQVAPQPGDPWTGSPLVATRCGLVMADEDSDHTWVWKAIPFAQPPTGELRWRAPRDPLPWQGVRHPPGFAPGCTRFSEVFPRLILGSEDCLYLNVWRPRDADRGLPVYVWIHGGGNSTGSAVEIPTYRGNRVAARSRLLFVSVDYRLGPFGWFTHPALRDGASPEDASGNFGTLDLIQSLRWIRQNIEAFGGDPKRVMITGESAGGIDVLSLLISPPARGLFHGAMSESGAALTRSMAEADSFSQALLERLLVQRGAAHTTEDAASASSSMGSDGIRSFLRSCSDRQILSLCRPVALGMIRMPTVLRDGVVIPRQGYDVLSTGDYPNKVPVILGSNADELTVFLRFGTRLCWQGKLYQAIARYGSQRWKVSGVDEVARRLAANPDQPPVYAYYFRWGTLDAQGRSPLPNQWGRELGAFHSLDIPFFLGQDTVAGVMQLALFSQQNERGRKALSSAMMQYAAAFARSGDPNPPDGSLPTWQPWGATPGGPRCMVFDAHGDEAVLQMSREELTDAQVMARARGELPEPLRSRTLEWLRESPLPSGVQ